MDGVSFRAAGAIAGLVPLTGGRSAEASLTRSLFRRWRAADPALPLDAAILRLEEAPVDVSLSAFARAKGRTAAGYRRAYAPLFVP
jgi:hypothetical protein